MSVPMSAGAAEPFCESGFADGHTVATFREQVNAWLARTVETSRERVCDILLATDEALANCADHAYPDDVEEGLVTLRMSYDQADQTVTIQVSDQGCWVKPTPRAQTSIRGRGLVLMRALADSCEVDGRVDGTTVCLQFFGCQPRREHAQAG